MRWNPVLKLPFVLPLLFVSFLFPSQARTDELPDPDFDQPTEFAGTVVDQAGEPVPNAKVEIHYYDGKNPLQTQETQADSEGQFHFRVLVGKIGFERTSFHARSPDGSQLSFDRMEKDVSNQRPVPIQLQLEEAKTGTIRVVDRENQPVEEAKLSVRINSGFNINAFNSVSPGQYTFSYPPSDRIHSVLAWKNGLGADYELYAVPRDRRNDQNAKAPEFPDNGATLELDGASSVTINVTDSEGNPLPDVDIYPWLLFKDSENDTINLSFSNSAFSEVTDADGRVTFEWIPRWQKRPITYWLSRDGFVQTRANQMRFGPETNLSVVMTRTVPIRGRVVDAEGKPAANIMVRAQGRGYAMDGGRGIDTTKHDGTFEMQVPGEQLYLLTVDNETWVSDGVPTFVVNDNQPVEGLELTLRKPTLVSGHITDEVTGEPVGNERMSCYLYGTPLNELDGVSIANPDDSNRYVRPMIYFAAETDEDGRYELKLGDGTYSLRPPQRGKAVEFKVAGESEKQVDASIETIQKVVLQGIVRNALDGTPVPGAKLEGVAREFIRTDWKASTDPAGKFSVETDGAAAYIHVTNEDGQLASITKIDDQTKSVEIELHPVGSARGVLYQRDSDEPATNTVINYAVNVPGKNNRSFSPRFGGKVTTDDEGKFLLDSLTANQEYSLSLERDSQGRSMRVGTAFVEPGEAVDLGTLKIPSPPKPYVPPTLDERIERAMAVDGTPLQRFGRAVHRIQRSKQMLLIAVGTVDEPRLHDFMQWRYEDSDYRKVRDDYLVMAINTASDAQKEQARELLDEIGIKNIEPSIEFSLVLVDVEAKLIEHASGDDFIVDGKLSKSHVIEWLDSFRPDPIDANELFAATLAKAKKQNKRVIVQETATWCGPCHMLSDFLSEHRAWEKDYLWVKMDHRYTGAYELMKELRDGADGGIPWFAIVDADGNRLVTSNQGEGGRNIGFPSSESGQRHLKRMLMQTKLTMTEDEITSLVDQLKEDD
ncbi:thioredoxin family protein [Rhodopirellula halodulae]|uniref:thioredoxin family protein n=1 Tax=Rhodopirellula halodulae TaxID=2894198 RepID=UPI001E5A73C9|nr:thioredoxin family protein [Rhodopirellula sp. JC737]MCC9655496.1 thioredoxin family protein [Rhodopirellula sp. JC737]